MFASPSTPPLGLLHAVESSIEDGGRTKEVAFGGQRKTKLVRCWLGRWAVSLKSTMHPTPFNPSTERRTQIKPQGFGEEEVEM